MKSELNDVTSNPEPLQIPSAPKKHADAINSSYGSVGEKIYETAKACAVANAKLNPQEKLELIKDLKFGKAKFSNYASIGGRCFMWEEIRPHLPVYSFSTPYALTSLTDEQLILMRYEKVLTPSRTREQTEAYGSA